MTCDALTVLPCQGLGAMRAFVIRAHEAGNCILVVTCSSNLEGRGVRSVLSSLTDRDGFGCLAGVRIGDGQRVAPR
jgi:orotidine-5'-phosphate decarboxylase